MSRCMFTQLLCCRSRFGVAQGGCATTAVLTSKNVLRHIGANATTTTLTHPSLSGASTRGNATDSKSRPVIGGQATILVQQGCGDIQELPVIIRRIGNSDDITALCASVAGDETQALLQPDSAEPTTTELRDADRIIQRLIEHDDGPMSVLAFVAALQTDERLPEVLDAALSRVLRHISVAQLETLESTDEVYNRLVDDLLSGCDAHALLQTMSAVPRPAHHQSKKSTAKKTSTAPPRISATPTSLPQSPAKSTTTSTTVRRLTDELLLRSTQSCLTVVEICECIHRFAECDQGAGADKFWSALADLDRTIDEHNIRFIYAALPQLRVSRRMVLGVLERRIRTVFWKMQPPAAADVMRSLVTVADAAGQSASSARTLQTLARWLNTNIHAVSEEQLLELVAGFTRLDFNDEQIGRALERYVKAKGVKIVDQALVLAILRHCAAFRLRNLHVLNGCAEHFTASASAAATTTQLDPLTVCTLVTTFGLLDYQPINGVRFWKAFEAQLERHFDELSPGEVIDVMLACVYLGKYPLNFTRRVFTPYFLDRLHTRTPVTQHAKLRADLKLFDTALTVECAEYAGPMLPRDHGAKSVWQDGRIRRVVQSMADVWTAVAGGEEKYSKHVVHQQLPFNALYVIDVLVHPAGMGQLWKFNVHTDRNVYAAVLVHVPEHYDAEGVHLVGAQAMRVRHLRMLGLRVVQLNYETLARLRVHGKELRAYVVERMREALPAIG